MAKPKIIIADSDANYIFPLQQKFVEEFFEKIDLEIITSEEYLEQFFSTPQRAEILIISEDLYDSSIHRHNLGNIFVMTEQQREEQTAELNINRIFKYTSIKEIFNEITGKSAEALKVENSAQKEPQIILVYSVCGGVGKTTVALGISACLNKNYKKVLYINAERLQTFGRFLENGTPIATADVYARLTNPTPNVYQDIKHTIRKEGFSYLPPFKAAIMSLGLKYSVYEKIAIAAKKSGEYDYIVIDADTTFDEDKANLLSIADKVIVVTNQTSSSVFATNMLASNINGINSDKYIFLCNDFDKDNFNALIAPNVEMKFSVNEYIAHFSHYENMKVEGISKESDMQKIAFLVI